MDAFDSFRIPVVLFQKFLLFGSFSCSLNCFQTHVFKGIEIFS